MSESVNESTASNSKQFDLQGWSRMIVGTVAVVVSTWQLFTKDIHGYIDTLGHSITRDVSKTVGDRMTVQLDSIRAELQRECKCPDKDDRNRRNR